MEHKLDWVSQLSNCYESEDIRTGSYNTRIIVRGITLGFMAFVTAMMGTRALTNPVNLYSLNTAIAAAGVITTFLFIWEYRKDNSYGLVVLENSETVYLIADRQERDEDD